MIDQTVQINKTLIGNRFKRSVHTYDTHALVQEVMAQRLASAVAGISPAGINRLLEIGCGTGLFTRALSDQLQVNQYFANDLVGQVAPLIRQILLEADIPNHQFIEGDAETVTFPADLDIICSGAVVQWFASPDTFFIRSAGALHARGKLAFSTFGPQNYTEIRQLTGSGLGYYTLDQLLSRASHLFVALHVSEWERKLWFSHPLEVLHHIKATGVGGVSGTKWNKAQLTAFMRDYGQFETEKGFPLTYHPQLFVFRKK